MTEVRSIEFQTSSETQPGRVAPGGRALVPVACREAHAGACDNGGAQSGWMRAGVSGDDSRAAAPGAGLPQLDAEMWPVGGGAMRCGCGSSGV